MTVPQLVAPSNSSAPALVEKLISRLPGETDRVVAQSLRTSQNVMLSARTTPNGTEVSIAPTAEGNPNYLAAARAVEMSLTPAPTSRLEAWLAEMEALTASRKGEAIDAGMKVAAYSRRLSEYPADVVKHVVLDTQRKWWPTWSELQDDLERMTAPRRLAVTKLREAHDAQSRPSPKPAPTLTDADRARMADDLAHFTAPSKQSPQPEPLTDEEIMAKYANAKPTRALMEVVGGAAQ